MHWLIDPPCPGSDWNRIPDTRRDDLIEFALEHEALTTRRAYRCLLANKFILRDREKIKKQTIQKRHLKHKKQAA